MGVEWTPNKNQQSSGEDILLLPLLGTEPATFRSWHSTSGAVLTPQENIRHHLHHNLGTGLMSSLAQVRPTLLCLHLGSRPDLNQKFGVLIAPHALFVC